MLEHKYLHEMTTAGLGGQRVLHQRWIWEICCMQVTKHVPGSIPTLGINLLFPMLDFIANIPNFV